MTEEKKPLTTDLESLAMVLKMLLDEANTGDADHVWDAEREIAALRKRVEELERGDVFIGTLDACRAALDEAVGLLKEMEWSFDANNEYGRWCLLCDACSSFGSQKPPKRHKEGCPLAAFLEKHGGT